MRSAAFAVWVVLFAAATYGAPAPQVAPLAPAPAETWQALSASYNSANAAREAVGRLDWEAARMVGVRAVADARAALRVLTDPCERKLVVGFLALGLWSQARGENARGASAVALEIAASGRREPELGAQDRGLLLALEGAILVELGVPDQAREPFERAMELTAKFEPEVCPASDPTKCRRHGRGPVRRNHAAYLDAHLGEVARLLAVGAYARAERLVDQTESGLDWEVAAEVMGPDIALARRAQITVRRAVARMGAAAGERAKLESARAEFERCFEFGAYDSQDAITACCGVLEIDLELGEIERAQKYLAEVDGWIAEDPANAGSLDDRAWLAALRARLRRLGGGDASASREELAAQLEHLLAEWRAVERTGGAGVFGFDRPRLLLVELFRASNGSAALEHAVRSQEFGVVWRELGGPAPNAAQVQAALCSEDTGCLLYVIGSAESVVLAFDSKSIEVLTVAKAAAIEPDVAALRSALLAADAATDRQREVLAQVPRRLADALFPVAVRERLKKWKHVRIVGLDQIGAPLQALPVLDGRPLGVTHAVSFLPSLAVGWKLAQRRSGLERRAKVALLGAPKAHENALAKFPAAGAVIDVERLAALVAAGGGRVVDLGTGAAATLGAVRRAKTVADILHVIAHGGVDLARELRTLVVLAPDKDAPDGLLTVERARELAAPDVVMLSVCRSADGVSRPGDGGASDLGGAFLIAGASSVVLSDLELRLGDALEFGELVHTRLLAGETLARAVQSANAAWLIKHPGRATWALPYVVGLGQ